MADEKDKKPTKAQEKAANAPRLHLANMKDKGVLETIQSAIQSAFKETPDICQINPSEQDVVKYRTGILSLDRALGIGGLLGGRILNTWGENGTGKTLLNMTIAGEVQRQGGVVGYIDAEGCVTGDTLITDAKTGSLNTIEDIVLGRASTTTVPCYDVDNVMIPSVGFMENRVNSGVKECLKFTTKRGATLSATHNHKVIVAGKGWMRMDELKVGDYIARPKVYIADSASEPNEQMPDAFYKIIGYLLGDGCLTNSSPRISIFNTDVLDDVVTLVAEVYPSLSVKPVGNSRGTWGITGDHFAPGSNPLLNDLKELGIMDTINSDKCLPDDFVNIDDDAVRHLIAGLIMSDGSVHASRPQMTYDTTSKKLAQQVKYLLHRIGVCSSILERKDSRKETYKTMYRVLAQGPTNLMPMVSVPLVSTKRENLLRGASQPPKQSIYTCVPNYIWTDMIVPDIKALDISSKETRRRLGYSDTDRDWKINKIGNTLPGKILTNVKATFGIDYTKWSPTNVWWDKIELIEDIGKQQVYDLSISKHHNFIANDIVIHNTFSPRFGRACGLDPENLIYVRSTPEKIMTGEDFFEVLRLLVGQGVHYIIVDSAPALVPSQKFNTNFGEGQQASHARLMAEELQKVTSYLTASTRTVVGFINQVRAKPMVMFGPKDGPTGGKALEFYMSYGFEMRKAKDLVGDVRRNDGSTEQKIIGVTISLSIEKNKTASKPVKPIEFDVYTEFAVLKDGTEIVPGIDIVKDIFEVASANNVIKQSGSWYSFGDLKGAGRLDFQNVLRKNPKVIEEIRAIVLGTDHKLMPTASKE